MSGEKEGYPSRKERVMSAPELNGFISAINTRG